MIHPDSVRQWEVLSDDHSKAMARVRVLEAQVRTLESAIALCAMEVSGYAAALGSRQVFESVQEMVRKAREAGGPSAPEGDARKET